MSLVNLTDTQLTNLCLTNSTIDPNCVCLLSGGGPVMNTDISGPGVRISFYLQSLFLGLMSARSASVEENTGALYTLVSTNLAMVVTSFILGFKAQPTMSLHDAVIVFYLLALSWTAIFFCVPTYNRFRKRDITLQLLYIFHSLIIFAFFLAILIVARDFGATPRCNRHAVAVVFKPFPALTVGRILAFIAIGIVILSYVVLTLNDYKEVFVNVYEEIWDWIKARRSYTRRNKAQETAAAATDQQHVDSLTVLSLRLDDAERGSAEPRTSRPGTQSRNKQPHKATTKEKNRKRKQKKEKTNENGAEEKPEEDNDSDDPSVDPVFNTGVYGRLVFEIVLIILLWGLFVMNCELLIVRNRFEGGGNGIGSDLWSFGQVLPMFLVILPFINLVKTFKKWKFYKRRHQRKVHTTEVPLFNVFSGFAQEQTRTNSHAHGYAHGHGHTHGYGHRHGPRPPPGSWFGNGRARPDFASFYSQGQQQTAHISVDSLHSTSSNYASYAKAGKVSKGKEREESSAPQASASRASLSTFVTADDSV